MVAGAVILIASIPFEDWFSAGAAIPENAIQFAAGMRLLAQVAR
jgi:hypothetical protein